MVSGVRDEVTMTETEEIVDTSLTHTISLLVSFSLSLSFLSDVWSSVDGRSWFSLGLAPWPARAHLSTVVSSISGRIMMCCGKASAAFNGQYDIEIYTHIYIHMYILKKREAGRVYEHRTSVISDDDMIETSHSPCDVLVVSVSMCMCMYRCVA